MKKVLTTVLNVICIAIIVLAVVILFSVVSTPKGQPPNVFGFSGFRVLTGSMEPGIMSGDLIISQKTAPESIEEGDATRVN